MSPHFCGEYRTLYSPATASPPACSARSSRRWPCGRSRPRWRLGSFTARRTLAAKRAHLRRRPEDRRRSCAMATALIKPASHPHDHHAREGAAPARRAHGHAREEGAARRTARRAAPSAAGGGRHLRVRRAPQAVRGARPALRPPRAGYTRVLKLARARPATPPTCRSSSLSTARAAARAPARPGRRRAPDLDWLADFGREPALALDAGAANLPHQPTRPVVGLTPPCLGAVLQHGPLCDRTPMSGRRRRVGVGWSCTWSYKARSSVFSRRKCSTAGGVSGASES